MNAQLPHVPLKIISTTNVNSASQIVLGIKGGSEYLKITNPKPKGQHYWIVIFDRSTLQVVENFMFSDNKSIPAKVRSFLGNSDYFYVLTTQQLKNAKRPQGPLSKWLIGEGAQLKKMEKDIGAINPKEWKNFSLTIVDIFGKAESALDYHNFQEPELSTNICLQPVMIEGKTLYTPAEL